MGPWGGQGGRSTNLEQRPQSDHSSARTLVFLLSHTGILTPPDSTKVFKQVNICAFILHFTLQQNKGDQVVSTVLLQLSHNSVFNMSSSERKKDCESVPPDIEQMKQSLEPNRETIRWQFCRWRPQNVSFCDFLADSCGMSRYPQKQMFHKSQLAKRFARNKAGEGGKNPAAGILLLSFLISCC